MGQAGNDARNDQRLITRRLPRQQVAGGQDDDLYLYAKADFVLKKNLNLTLLFGIYDYDAPDTVAREDYKHFHVSLSKDDFVFALDKNDADLLTGRDDLRFSVAYSKTIDLL